MHTFSCLFMIFAALCFAWPYLSVGIENFRNSEPQYPLSYSIFYVLLPMALGVGALSVAGFFVNALINA